MNIVQLQEQLKNFSQDQLVREMQMPSGNAPQFLVLGEIMRRQKLQQDFAANQAKGASQSTVAEDAVAAAGVPQQGLAGMARAMAPQTDMAENTGVVAMASGGYVKKMAKGGAAMTDPAVIAMANRLGMSVQEYLRSVGDEQAAKVEESAARRAMRERMVGMEPAGEGVTMPTQADLDRSFMEDRFSAVSSRPLVAPAVEETNFAPPVDVGRIIGSPMVAPGLAGLAAVSDARPPTIIAATPATPERPRPFLPGPAAATELNLPAFRNATAPDRGAGLATGLRAAAETGPLPIDPRIAAAEETLRNQLIEQGFDSGEIDMEAEAKKSAEEAAAARDEAGITESRTAPFTEKETTPNTQPDGGAASGGIAGAGGMSSYEQELMDMLNRREKASQQDKWLALAQVGLNMMSSTQPSLLGAIGEAGVKGVEAARAARDQYDKDRLDLLGALEQSRQSRAAAAARASRGASSGGIGGLKLKDYLAAINDDIERIDTILAAPPMTAMTPEQELDRKNLALERDALVAKRYSLLYEDGTAIQDDDAAFSVVE